MFPLSMRLFSLYQLVKSFILNRFVAHNVKLFLQENFNFKDFQKKSPPKHVFMFSLFFWNPNGYFQRHWSWTPKESMPSYYVTFKVGVDHPHRGHFTNLTSPPPGEVRSQLVWGS